MGKITLFGMEASPLVRAVLLTLNALNLPHDYVEITRLFGEQLEQKFLKKHPQATVPALEDGDINIYESRAINVYLVEKYAKSDDLYPKDLLKRAQVDQRLYFESGAVFFCVFRNASDSVYVRNKKELKKPQVADIIDMYNILEDILKDQLYIAGDKLTIADFSFIGSVLTFDVFVSIDSSKYAKLTAWIQRIKQLPYYNAACGLGADKMEEMIKSKNLYVLP